MHDLAPTYGGPQMTKKHATSTESASERTDLRATALPSRPPSNHEAIDRSHKEHENARNQQNAFGEGRNQAAKRRVPKIKPVGCQPGNKRRLS
jgi:hypothetical protein